MKNKILKIVWDVDKLAWGNLIHILVYLKSKVS